MCKLNKSENKPSNISRREFIGRSALAATAFTIVPRFVLGGSGFQSPSDKLNIACVGAGGMGRNDVKGVSSENIVALCDADWTRAAETFANYPKAKKYQEWFETHGRQGGRSRNKNR